jgi:ATP-dependent Clp protease, protease subunit
MMMGRSVFNASAKVSRNMGDGHEQESSYQPDPSRIVLLNGDVTEHSVGALVAQMLYLANENNRKPMYLMISTYGGCIDSMFSLYDMIKFLPCPVYTVALGKVMSAGILLLASGSKGKRLIGKSTRLMIHSVSGGMQGNVFEMANESKEQVRLHEQMIEAIVSETKMNREELNTIMNLGHDYYITAEQAIKYGIVDQIIGA